MVARNFVGRRVPWLLVRGNLKSSARCRIFAHVIEGKSFRPRSAPGCNKIEIGSPVRLRVSTSASSQCKNKKIALARK